MLPPPRPDDPPEEEGKLPPLRLDPDDCTPDPELERGDIPPDEPEGEGVERGEAGALVDRSGDLGTPQEPVAGPFGEAPEPGAPEGWLPDREVAPAGSAAPE